MGVIARIMMGLAAKEPDNSTISIDVAYLNAHRTASSLWVKKSGAWTPDRSYQGRYEYETAAVTDTIGRPIRRFMAAGQVSDYTGARALVSSLPAADWLLGDRRYDADWFREDPVNTGITPCNPGRKPQEKPVKYDRRRYKRRNGIEIMFGRPKDWRRVATRYDRCPKVFLSAIALAATVLFRL